MSGNALSLPERPQEACVGGCGASRRRAGRHQKLQRQIKDPRGYAALCSRQPLLRRLGKPSSTSTTPSASSES